MPFICSTQSIINKSMFKNYLQLLLRLSIFVFSLSAIAQTVAPPNINYTTLVTNYKTGNPISRLTPTNTAGAVASAGNVASTYKGISGTSGNTDGLASSAPFSATVAMVADAVGNGWNRTSNKN